MNKKLRRIERYGSLRAKVFCKRARRLGWSATSIVCAVAFGFESSWDGMRQASYALSRRAAS